MPRPLQTALQTRTAIAVLTALAALSGSAALGAEASPWDGDGRSAIRLVAGNRSGADLRAGVEVRLGDGWKTYWRYPGDAGVPPSFDFSKSDNVRSVSVQWPAPHRFEFDGGASIGYKGEVMFPIHVVLADPSQPATLRLVLEYAVCEKLCVPARGETLLTVQPAQPPANQARLATAEARTPRSVQVGDRVKDLAILAVRLEPATPHPRVVVDVTAPPDAPLDLFAEGPAPEWALPLPEPVTGTPPGHQRFVFDLDGAPPGVDGKAATLRFTLVSGENAIEAAAVPK